VIVNCDTSIIVFIAYLQLYFTFLVSLSVSSVRCSMALIICYAAYGLWGVGITWLNRAVVCLRAVIPTIPIIVRWRGQRMAVQRAAVSSAHANQIVKRF